jgi:integrase
MAILIECPKCGKRHGEREKKVNLNGNGKSVSLVPRQNCTCGFGLGKAGAKVYWIEYYLKGNRKRERIGPNRAAAEHRLREVLSLRTENRYIRRTKKQKFSDLTAWYLDQPNIKARRSNERDEFSIKNLRPFFGSRYADEITPGLVDAYRTKREGELSRLNKPPSTATLNREIACLRRILNYSLAEGKIDDTSLGRVRLPKEHNRRSRVVTAAEYHKLLEFCLPHTRNAIVIGYLTGMRVSEILNLKWDRIDLDAGFIRLKKEDTKEKAPRNVPLYPELIDLLQSLSRHPGHDYVLAMDGKPIKSIKKSFKTACKSAGLKNLWFHDLRRTRIDMWESLYNTYLIRAAVGHAIPKADEVHSRYIVITDLRLKTLVAGSPDIILDF